MTTAIASPVVVTSFYGFADLPAYRSLHAEVEELCKREGLLGTVQVAGEGVNGSVAGSAAGTAALIEVVTRALAPGQLRVNRSTASAAPFHRMKVRAKRRIVAFGEPEVAPQRVTGRHVEPTQWNALIERPDVLVIDVRNDYEHRIGSFENAAVPDAATFAEFTEWAARVLDPEEHRHVAMYCTGGIRCEKASAWLIAQGFEDVAQLDGGILNYLAEIPAEASRWRGECFVFDHRVALDADLAPGTHVLCHGCRRPLSPADCASPHYRPGVSCPHCHDTVDAGRRRRLDERARQSSIAARRGERHVGAVMPVRTGRRPPQ